MRKKLLFLIISTLIITVMPPALFAEEKNKSAAQDLETMKKMAIELYNNYKNGAEKENAYHISKGDTLDIKVYKEDDLSGEYEVLGDGTISFPLLDKVSVEGLSKRNAEKKIKELLEKDYLVEAHVNITIKEAASYRQVTIIGEVKNPGTYPFPEDRGLTLIEAISLAGGFTRYASVGGTRVIRGRDEKNNEVVNPRVKGILNGSVSDLKLEPGDKIIVPERFF